MAAAAAVVAVVVGVVGVVGVVVAVVISSESFSPSRVIAGFIVNPSVRNGPPGPRFLAEQKPTVLDSCMVCHMHSHFFVECGHHRSELRSVVGTSSHFVPWTTRVEHYVCTSERLWLVLA